MMLEKNEFFTSKLSTNLSPTGAILGSFTFSSFSHSEKCNYLKNIKRRILSWELIEFCISNIKDSDLLLELYDLHIDKENHQQIYSLEPFDSINDLISDLKKNLSLGDFVDENDFDIRVLTFAGDYTPIQQLLAFDFYEFSLTQQFGKSITSFEFNETSIITYETIVKLIEQMEENDSLCCKLNDVCHSMFFNTMYFDGDKWEFKPRFIQNSKITIGRSYTYPDGSSGLKDNCSDDIESLTYLLNFLTNKKSKISSGVQQRILEHALFPPTENAPENYKLFTKWEKKQQFHTLCFLGNRNNYAIQELIPTVLNEYTPEIHKAWSDDHNFFADAKVSHICSLVANPFAIYKLGHYFTRELRNKTDQKSLLLLSAIAYNAPIPPSLSGVLNNYIFKSNSENIEPWDLFKLNSDKEDYQNNLEYLYEYGSDDHFITNLFHGFDIRNDALFSHSDIPTNKQDLQKFLIFSDGVSRLIGSINNLRYHIESYVKDNGFDNISDLQTMDHTKFESEWTYKWWIESIGADVLTDSLRMVDFYSDNFNQLDAFYQLIRNSDIEFVNATMLFSPLSKTDLMNNISIHENKKALTLEEIQDEFKSCIQANSSELKEHTRKTSSQIDNSIEKNTESLGELSYELRSETNKIISTLSPKASVLNIINLILLIVIIIKIY
ncbi:MAG: hypothetical protein V5789_12795 [Colwellia sp.]